MARLMCRYCQYDDSRCRRDGCVICCGCGSQLTAGVLEEPKHPLGMCDCCGATGTAESPLKTSTFDAGGGDMHEQTLCAECSSGRSLIGSGELSDKSVDFHHICTNGLAYTSEDGAAHCGACDEVRALAEEIAKDPQRFASMLLGFVNASIAVLDWFHTHPTTLRSRAMRQLQNVYFAFCKRSL